jgi:biopolymer transport protein ExbD/biopolymer transport protein TolR
MSGGGGELNSEINVTPMVDIMLVLLIIFMVITPFLQQGVTVAIPRDMRNPDEDSNINKETSVIIAIPKDGQYFLGKKPKNIDDLKSDVQKALANKKEEDKIVYIKSGVEVSYGEVVKVINAVREKGVDKIGLIADKKKKGPAAAPAPAT